MTDNQIIIKNDSICLLEDAERCFLLLPDGSYIGPDRLAELAEKLAWTADRYGEAIHRHNAGRRA